MSIFDFTEMFIRLKQLGNISVDPLEETVIFENEKLRAIVYIKDERLKKKVIKLIELIQS